jgi:RsiW-degrading membrane proteinase PrsW (M82 family)
MNEIHITFEGQGFSFRPGQVIRIGRDVDNDVVVSVPTVSRQHAKLTFGPDGWVFENIGQAPAFLHGQPVRRLVVRSAMDLALASPDGAVLRIGLGTPAAGGPSAPRWTHVMGDPLAPGDSGGPQVFSPPVAPPKDELATAFQILVPVKSWLTDPGWRQGLRLLVIPYALLPLVFIALFSSSGNLTTPGWAYSLYIAPLWVIAFWLLIRPGPVKALEVQIGVGMICWVLVWIKFVTVAINTALVSNPKAPVAFPLALGVGFNEEITKALPVLLAALVIRKFRSAKLDVLMWMFLGTIAGLTFGVSEQAVYTVQDILNINQAQANSQAVVAVLGFAERVFIDGFQHAIWAGVAAFFIGMAVNYPRRRVPLIVFGISIPALLHALNDWSLGAFGSSSLWVWIVIQAVSLLLFLGYTMSAASIERQVRQTPLFRGESMIMEGFREPPGADIPMTSDG